MSNDTLSDFSSLEEALNGSPLAERLVEEFRNVDRQSIVPAMLAWLYYGRSYECMLSHVENLIRDSRTSMVHGWMLKLLGKYIIRKSIASGARTRADWEEWRENEKIVSADGLIDSSFVEDEQSDADCTVANDQPKEGATESKKRGRPKDERTLEELLKPDDNVKLLLKIRQRLLSKPKERDIVYLKIALEESDLLNECDIAPFWRALSNYYNVRLVGERGVQKSYKLLTEVVASTGNRMIDMADNRSSIDEIKAFLLE